MLYSKAMEQWIIPGPQGAPGGKFSENHSSTRKKESVNTEKYTATLRGQQDNKPKVAKWQSGVYFP